MKSKTKALTPEEKLSQALLPREEWPYELPKGWVWTRVEPFIQVIRGVTYKKNDVQNISTIENALILRGGNIEEGTINLKMNDNVFVDKSLISEEQYVKVNDAVIVASTGSKSVIGKAGIVYEECPNVAIGAFLLLIRPLGNVNFKYVDYYFETSLYRNNIRKLSNGVNINNVKQNYIKESHFPLPPLPEQQRIVDKIESLFAKLDEAGDRLQKVLDGYEARRAAILHEAFSGKWTGDSGEQSDIKRLPLKKCGVWHGGGTPSKSHSEYWANGSIMWITSKDMKTDVIENSLIYVNEKGIENSSAVYSDKPAVLFVMRSGVLRHTLPIAMVSKPYTVNQDLKALTPEEGLLPEYVMWACKAEEKTILNQCMKSGTTVESINFQSLLNFQIPVYPEKKQRYIVDRIHKALTSEESSFNHISSVYTQIDLLKKSILARAFQGELGTQNPSDPWALDLLKECMMAGKEDSKS